MVELRVAGVTIVLATTIAACTQAPQTSGSELGSDATTTTTISSFTTTAGKLPTGTVPTTVVPPSTAPPDSTTSTTRWPAGGVDAACIDSRDPVPWTGEEVVSVPVVAELEDGSVLRAAVYPRPDYDARLWSQWGEGIVLDDGRVLSAIGDHDGADGNSFFFVYDPIEHSLTRFGDVLSLVDHTPGDWGFGKVHAQMVLGPCSDVLVSTYWGTRSGLTFSNGYRGDVLIRVDPAAETLSTLGGVILDGHGVASMAARPDGSVLFAEAANPLNEAIGAFVALDGFTGEQIHVEEATQLNGFRAMGVIGNDRVMMTWSGDRVAVYDSGDGVFTVTDRRLPGTKLRAVEPTEDGLVGVTQDPPVFFRADEIGQIESLGAARGYTTSITSPDGRRFWYIPDAHGGAWKSGTPLIEFDAETGRDRVIVELNPTIGSALGYRLGGTYNITSSADGSEIYVGLNGAPESDDESFGEVIFVVIELP